MLACLFAIHIVTVPGAAEAMNFIKEEIKPIIQYSMDWGIKAGLAATSTHAFIVLCKRFLDEIMNVKKITDSVVATIDKYQALPNKFIDTNVILLVYLFWA